MFDKSLFTGGMSDGMTRVSAEQRADRNYALETSQGH